MRTGSGNEGTHLRHDRKERGLADVCGFSRHIRACDDHHAVFVAVEKRVVGNEALSFHCAVQHGMPPRLNFQQIVVRDFRTAVGVALGAVRKGAENVDFGKCGGGQLNLRCKCPGKLAEFFKELDFQRLGFVFGAENLAFHLLEPRCDEAFAVDKRLFADVVVGDGRKMCFCDFNEIAEYAIVVDFQGFDAAALLLFRLKLRHPPFAVRRGGPEFVELLVVSFADYAAVGDGRGRFIDDGGQDLFDQFWHFADIFPQAFDQRQVIGRKQSADRRNHFKAVCECEHVARVDVADVEACNNAFKVAHRPHGFAQLGKRQRIVLEKPHDILTFHNAIHVFQRLQQPVAHQTAPHGGVGPVEHIQQSIFL